MIALASTSRSIAMLNHGERTIFCIAFGPKPWFCSSSILTNFKPFSVRSNIWKNYIVYLYSFTLTLTSSKYLSMFNLSFLRSSAPHLLKLNTNLSECFNNNGYKYILFWKKIITLISSLKNKFYLIFFSYFNKPREKKYHANKVEKRFPGR